MKTKTSLWRSFWANPGSTDARSLSVNFRFALLQRAAAPQFSFRCSRWPPQKQIASELDRVQQNMCTTLVRLPREEGENVVWTTFVRRRGRHARGQCQDNGLWSHLWFKRALKWDAHLARIVNARSWASRLRSYTRREWLMEQRRLLLPLDSNVVLMTAGRTGTRTQPGKVHMRFHDGLEFVQIIL